MPEGVLNWTYLENSKDKLQERKEPPFSSYLLDTSNNNNLSSSNNNATGLNSVPNYYLLANESLRVVNEMMKNNKVNSESEIQEATAVKETEINTNPDKMVANGKVYDQNSHERD